MPSSAHRSYGLGNIGTHDTTAVSEGCPHHTFELTASQSKVSWTGDEERSGGIMCQKPT